LWPYAPLGAIRNDGDDIEIWDARIVVEIAVQFGSADQRVLKKESHD